MINKALHKNPVALDREKHLKLRLRRPLVDLAPVAKLNATFIAVAEFADVAREYAIVFVRAGKNEQTGKDDVAPMAVLGLGVDENLYVAGATWSADYVPFMLRMYPFAIARIDAQQYAVCIDDSCSSLNDKEGDALFNIDGTPSDFTLEMQKTLEQFEAESQRTRAFCQRLGELDLLSEMRFDADAPDGNKLSVDGFLAVNEKKFAELPDAVVLELHRNGILSLLSVQMASMGHMRRLVARRLRQAAA